jgi:hypothetical protein
MAWVKIDPDDCRSGRAVGQIEEGSLVKIAPGVTNGFQAVATSTDRVAGWALAAAASGEAVAVAERGNEVKLTAAASLGAGAALKVASVNGAVAPGGAAASGFRTFIVGDSEVAAQPGDRFSAILDPREIAGTVA